MQCGRILVLPQRDDADAIADGARRQPLDQFVTAGVRFPNNVDRLDAVEQRGITIILPTANAGNPERRLVVLQRVWQSDPPSTIVM